MSRLFSFLVEDIPAEYVDKMIATGLYGDDEGEVLRGLVYAGVREAISGGLIDRLEVPEEAVEDPGTGEVAISKCEHCKDGAAYVPDATPTGTCPQCGRDVEIPF